MLVKASDVAGEDNGVCDSGPFSNFDFVIFALPEGYRPERANVFATVSSDQPSRVDVTGPSVFGPAGRVLMDPNVDPEFTKAKKYLSLNGISFEAAE